LCTKEKKEKRKEGKGGAEGGGGREEEEEETGVTTSWALHFKSRTLMSDFPLLCPQ
jgi:hypothetical protein